MCGFSYLLALLVIHLLVAHGAGPAGKVASGTSRKRTLTRKREGRFQDLLDSDSQKTYPPYGK
jgi:hypothetical protein